MAPLARSTGWTKALVGAILFAAAPAAADDKAACLDAAGKAQRLRGDHQLVEARAQLQVCASARCPAVVSSDCANWLAEVDKALPSVVVTAKSAAGADLVDVRVTVDGQPFLSKLDGKAMSLNAGAHAFHFEGAGATLDRQALIREGEKDQSIAVVLGADAGPTPITPPAASDSTTPAASSSSTPLRTAGWVLGGAGVVGLVVGGVAGGIALSNKGSDCSGNACQPGTSSGIKSTALVSDIGWIAGGVLVASGLVVILVAPSTKSGAGSVAVAPTFGAGAAGAVLAGSF